MKNLGTSFNKFIKNKSTVSVLAFIAIMVVLFFGYNSTVNKAIQPIKIVVANVDIQPKTQITSDMIKVVNVPAQFLSGKSIYYTPSEVIGKYTHYNTLVPEGSMLYKKAIVDENVIPDIFQRDLPEGYDVFYFPVSTTTTYGNSIMPGSYINIDFKYVDDDGIIKIGRLLENIKILDVRDASGKPVFENTDLDRRPSFLLFAVPTETNYLLRRAFYLQASNAELIPMPTNIGYTESPAEFRVSNTQLVQYIDSKTQTIDPDEIIIDDYTINDDDNLEE